MKYASIQSAINSVNMRTSHGGFIIKSGYSSNMSQSYEPTSPKKVKRFRSAFTTDQVNYLEQQFKTFPYIGNAHRKEVATALNINERAVKIWFQNRRMKEKKEVTNKEFDGEISNQHFSNRPKSLELAKGQLNNVVAPSTNEQYSLPLVNDVGKLGSEKVIRNNIKNNLSSGVLVKDLSKMDEGTSSATEAGFYKTRQSVSPINYIKSPAYSIDVCDQFKKEPMSKINVTNFPQGSSYLKLNEQKPMNYAIAQQIPEDLSANRKPVPAVPQLHDVPPSNPGYISVVPNAPSFYAQPYYTAGGVIWKPVNLMPSVPAPPSLSMPVSNNISAMSPESLPENCCCACHMKPLMPLNYQQQSPSPQYIITAVQLPNPSATKF